MVDDRDRQGGAASALSTLAPIALCLALGLRAAAGAAATPEQIPFVGCESDGQTGPVPAPEAVGGRPAVPPALAPQLAYYVSEDLAVLAPRGWHCFGLYGSTGTILIVTPEAHSADDLLKAGAKLAGPAIELSSSSVETSGRFYVAEVAARLFPTMQDFVQEVIDEGIEPAENFPKGPYPDNVLRRHGDTDVEFETPAGKDGMGTKSRLAKSRDPIGGVAFMANDDDDLIVLNVRVPGAARDLVPAIIEATRASGGAAPSDGNH